ncbi:hypothetical protein ACVNP0_07895 [Staphylococcus aureus]
MMKREPTFLESISTMIVMVIVVVTGFVFFDIPIQVLLIIASAYATWIAKRVGLTWQDLEKGIAERLNTAMPAILIILAVGIYSRQLDVFWHSASLDLLWLRFIESKLFFNISLFYKCCYICSNWYSMGLCINCRDCTYFYW